MKKPIPQFKSEDEEIEFWDTYDFDEYFEPSDFKRFNLSDILPTRPRTKRVTLRLPERLIAKYKQRAQQVDVPYQSLMKQALEKGPDSREDDKH